ncbi:alpha/beta fold hydrolase [Streptomyces avermitilis]|uniref:alpha/beta fold hydrolase n=1 Tax=Streptomyces avermitilis TaxID=33903 RepID=UPI00382A1DE8
MTANWQEGVTESTIQSVPVLVIAGEEDSQVPVHVVRKMADAIEGSTFRVLQHTAHLAARENPEGVNAEIDAFLAALPDAA